ncbi:MAG: MATE family efflux transporter [Pseudomonadota bacterium]
MARGSLFRFVGLLLPRPAGAAQLNRTLWRLAWPLMISNLGAPLLGLTDSFVAGHLGSVSDFGAVILGANLMSILFWSFGFLRMGTTALAAQASAMPEQSFLVLIRALLSALAIGLFLWIVAPIAGWLILPHLGVSSAVVDASERYCLIVLISAPFYLVNLAVAGWLIGTSQTPRMLVMTIVITGVNILLDLVLVFGFGAGIAGIAAATVAAQITGTMLIAVPLLVQQQRKHGWPLPSIILERTALLALFSMNGHLWVRTVVLMLALSVPNILAGRLDDTLLAANGLLWTLFILVSYFIDGFAVASETLAGKAHGQRDSASMIAVTRTSMILSWWMAIAMAVLLALFGSLAIFHITPLEPVQELALAHFWWVVMLPVSAVACFVLDGLFIGAGETRALQGAMLISVAIFIPVILVMAALFSLHGIWASLHIFMAVRAFALARRWPKLIKQA